MRHGTDVPRDVGFNSVSLRDDRESDRCGCHLSMQLGQQHFNETNASLCLSVLSFCSCNQRHILYIFMHVYMYAHLLIHLE